MKKNNNNGSLIKYNSLKIQDDLSVMCGWYCIYYIKERNKGKSMYDVLHSNFGFDEKENEKVIDKYKTLL